MLKFQGLAVAIFSQQFDHIPLHIHFVFEIYDEVWSNMDK